MHRFALIALFTAVAWPQSDNPFNRAPADVDKALRSRVQEFFGYHVTGEFRKAEAIVAEDTKEYFYTHGKPKYISIEIKSVDYSENFTRASVMVLCEQIVNMPGFVNQPPIKIPTPSAWKLEDGKWMWWVDPAKVGQSPFGTLKPGPPAAPGAAMALPTLGAAQPPTSADFLYKQMQIDKSAVALRAGESDTVTISNGAPGVMTLRIPNLPRGIDATFDKTTLQSGEKATLTIRPKVGATTSVLEVVCDPIGQILPVEVTVKPGPPVYPPDPLKAERSEVSLKAGESATVVITNSAAGPVELKIPKALPGISATFDKSTLPSGEIATLTIKAAAKATPGTLEIRCDPGEQTLPVRIAITPAAKNPKKK